LVGFFLPVAGVALEAAFLAGALAFEAAAFAFAGAVVPVTAFLAAPRLEAAVVFFAAGAVFLPATTFLGAALALVAVGLATGLALAAVLAAADFLATAVVLLVPVDLAEADVAVVRGLGAVFLGIVALALAVLAALGFAATFGLGAGLFSFAAEVSLAVFGGSFTRPEGPLGKTNVPFSAPEAIALLSWVFWAFPISSLY